PAACGFAEFSSEKHPGSKKDVDLFVASLKNAISELKMAYPALHDSMKTDLVAAFELFSDADFRAILSRRTQQLALAITEPALKSFCSRLVTFNCRNR